MILYSLYFSESAISLVPQPLKHPCTIPVLFLILNSAISISFYIYSPMSVFKGLYRVLSIPLLLPEELIE